MRTEWIDFDPSTYHLLIDTLVEGVIVHAPDGSIVAHNLGALRILGLKSDELRGRTPQDPRWQTIQRDGTPYPCERYPVNITLRTAEPVSNAVMGVRHTSGKLTWVSINSRPLVHPDGSVGALATFLDITWSVQAEDAVIEAAEQFRTLVEKAPSGVFTTDPKGRCTFVNHRWCEMTGLSEDEVFGDGWVRAVHPDDRGPVVRAIEHAAQRGDETSIEYRYRRPNGRVVWVVMVGSAIRAASGSIDGYLGIVTDISERKRAEEQRDRFFVLSADMLCVATTDGRFLRVNPAFTRTLGYSEAELMNESLLSFVHPDDRDITVSELAKLAAGNDSIDFENRYRCKDGAFRWLAWRCPAPVEGSAEVYAVARDVTDQKAAAAALKEQAEKDSLTGLGNRASFQAKLRAVLGSAKDRSSSAVVFIDLDRFKEINDVHGHEAGDFVLRQIAERIGQRIRRTDFAARLGGDEFTVLLTGLRRNEDATIVAYKLLDDLDGPVTLPDGKTARLGASIGVTCFLEDDDETTVLRRADEAMYRAKRAGRNQVRAG